MCSTHLFSIILYYIYNILHIALDISAWHIKFVFSKKDTEIDEIFTDNLTLTTYCQIYGEDFFNFFSLLRKHEL